MDGQLVARTVAELRATLPGTGDLLAGLQQRELPGRYRPVRRPWLVDAAAGRPAARG